MEPADKGGVSELYIVYTEFINMVVQKVRVLRMLPVEVVKEDKSHLNVPDTTTTPQVRPLYSFEPRRGRGARHRAAKVRAFAYP